MNQNHIQLDTLNEGVERNMKVMNLRRDAYGNIISRKSKRHKISFIDVIDRRKCLAEIQEVESYRIYNRVMDAESKDKMLN